MQHLLQIIKSRYKRSIFQEQNKVNIPVVYMGKLYGKAIDIYLFTENRMCYMMIISIKRYRKMRDENEQIIEREG